MSTTVPFTAIDAAPPFASARPRIGFDARFSLGEYRGMGRYLRRLIRPISAQAVGFCAAGESDPDLRLVARGANFYPAWEQLALPQSVADADLDIFIAPYNTAPLRLPAGVKLILVLHDFIYMRSTRDIALSRSLYQNFGRLYRRLIVPQAIRRAHHIVCVSQHTRRELVQRFHGDPAKISVIPNTIDQSWFSLPRISSVKPYVLCVSGEAPNKNLKVALAGFAQYCRIAKDRQTSLQVAGVKLDFHARFRSLAAQLGIANRVVFLPYLSDRELRSLYAGARAFFFPSRDEGFGIPVLEAMAAGVPTVASSAASIPEVAGDTALYCHPDSPSQMAEQLAAVLSDPALQQTMRSRGLARAQQLHPLVIDAAIADFWRKLLADA